MIDTTVIAAVVIFQAIRFEFCAHHRYLLFAACAWSNVIYLTTCDVIDGCSTSPLLGVTIPYGMIDSAVIAVVAIFQALKFKFVLTTGIC